MAKSVKILFLALAAMLVGVVAAAPAVAAPAKKTGAHDWTKVVVATPEGGYRIGNPNAKVKLIEYASVWCPHCKHFHDTGVGPLRARYVSTGKVSYEIRNFVLNPMDLPATLLVRCGGVATYLRMLDAFYARQTEWETAAVDALNADGGALERFGALPPEQASLAVAKWIKLDSFAKSLGFTDAKFAACVGDKAAIDKVAAYNNSAVTDHDLKATPTFIINGVTQQDTNSWEELEPKLRAAL